MADMGQQIRTTLLVLVVAGVGLAQGKYEHRVVVATTSWDRYNEIHESLERNVNALAAQGFAVGAVVGGNAGMMDRLLERQAVEAGTTGHGAHAFVVMHRPETGDLVKREYRLLQTQVWVGVDKQVKQWGEEGFRLKTASWVGPYFHGVFERVEGQEKVEYRVYRTARRKGWDQQIMADPEARKRLRRVVAMFLDTALAELGPAQESEAEFVWEIDGLNERSRHEPKLQARGAAGFRVQMVRVRRSELDVALLKPAGKAEPVKVELEDGPWGAPCGRGRIAGVDMALDGEAYCVAENVRSEVVNVGVDMELREGATFGRQFCETRARMMSPRAAGRRLARARQMEEELNRDVKPGYRVQYALAGVQEGRSERLVFFATNEREALPGGEKVRRREAVRLRVELDELGDQLRDRREKAINEGLEAEGVTAWVELNPSGGRREALLLGCVETRLEQREVESLLWRLLVGEGLADYRVRNELLQEGFR